MNFKPETPQDRLMIALDTPNTDEAFEIFKQTKDLVSIYKIGSQLIYDEHILAFRDTILSQDKKIFLDTKLLDTCFTVEKALAKIKQFGATFTTIHCYGNTCRGAFEFKINNGPSKENRERDNPTLCILGVLLLSDLSDEQMRSTGYSINYCMNPRDLIKFRLTQFDIIRKVDGVICPPQYTKLAKDIQNEDTLFRDDKEKKIIVTPGIKLENEPSSYEGGIYRAHEKTYTPKQAILAGSDYIVVGRTITTSKNPQETTQQIIKEIEEAANEVEKNTFV